jgi:hypothetical protein
MNLGLGQPGQFVPMQKLILAMWKFIYTVATTRKAAAPLVIDNPAPEAAPAPIEAASANESLALAPAQSSTPALAPSQEESLALPQEAMETVVGEIVEEGSLEAEFFQRARRIKLEELYAGDDSIYMEADLDSQAVRGAIGAALGTHAINGGGANDNYRFVGTVGTVIAGLLPPAGRYSDGNGDQGLNAARGDTDLAERLQAIATTAESSQAQAVTDMRALLAEQANSLETSWPQIAAAAKDNRNC